MLQEVVLDMGKNVYTRSVPNVISTSDFKAQSDFIFHMITPSFKEFFRTNTLSHQCPYTEHAHFNQIEYAMNLLV